MKNKEVEHTSDLVRHLHTRLDATVLEVKFVVAIDFARVDTTAFVLILLIHEMQIVASDFYIFRVILVALPLVVCDLTAIAARLVNVPFCPVKTASSASCRIKLIIEYKLGELAACLA